MDPNDPFTLILQAIIGGVVESVAGKAMEGAPRLMQRAKALLGMVDRQPISASEQAVAAAVEAARLEVIAACRARDEVLSDATSQRMVELLNHAPFAEEVANRLLLRGRLDPDRLRRHYLACYGAPTSAGWPDLEYLLIEFFDAIENHLLADPNLGPMLRETAQLASLIRLEGGTQLIAEYSRQALNVQTRIAANTEQGAQTLHSLLLEVGGGNAHLGQIVGLLGAILARLPAGEGERPSLPLQNSAAEAPYLRVLRERCNRLPLALTVDKRGASRGKDEQPTLASVYVDLQVAASPSLERILTRLQVPQVEWDGLRRKLDIAGQATRKQGGRTASGAPVEDQPFDMEALLKPVNLERVRTDREEWQKHPLQPWAKDPEALSAAAQPLLALETLADHRQVVLLGNPGSGKSTLVNHLAYTLAGARLGEDQEWQTTLHAAFAQPLLPLRVVLRQWSAHLHAHSPSGLELAYNALESLHSGLTRSELIATFERGDALVLFDGLDETPISAGGDHDGHPLDRRRRIVDAVAAFCVAHPRCHVLVTSRVKPYQQAGDDYRLPKLPVFSLAPLDDPRVATFIQRWYDELTRLDPARQDEAARACRRLLSAVQSNRDLREMAGDPILLTMLARINSGQPLPESRAALYHECVEQLLYDWDEIKAEDVRAALAERAAEAGGDASAAASLPTLQRLLSEPGVAKKSADFERVLWETTFASHKASGRRQADLLAETLEKKLAALHSDPHQGKAWASRVVEFIQQRSGLLIETETGVFSFPHHSFQEYLAARWLLEQEGCPQQAAELAAIDHWREVILLACGYLADNDGAFNRVVSIIDEIAPSALNSATDWARLLVAGQAWKEFDGRNRRVSKVGDRLANELPVHLTALMQNKAASATQRLEAGLLAADIAPPPAELTGDPVLVSITGLCDTSRSYDFQIGQYPITNAQYKCFMDAGGYDKSQAWWTPKAIKEIESFETRWPTAPRLWDNERFNHSTQPVVAVSWYEAMAYCAWLSEEWSKQDRLDKLQEVRLPTEAEWQWAAAGPAKRTYAWGEQFDAWRTNSSESNLNRTTPVHMYPDGVTPPGAWAEQVWDLCGNVWEWTSSPDRTYTSAYQLVGGAYWKGKDDVGTAARDWNLPGFRGNDGGFRVVVVPISR
jgi:hypothetical protein